MFLLAAIDPIAIELGPLRIHWYGIIFGLAIWSAFWWGMRESKRLGLNQDHMAEVATYAVPMGILGARLYEVFILQWGYYSQNPGDILAVWKGGLAIHGGVLLGAATGIFIIWRRQQSIPLWGDVIMPGVLLAQAIGRWGNFVNQEAYGAPASERVVELMPAWMREQMTINGAVHHPTFFYESVWNFVMFGMLVWVARKVNPKRGSIFFLYWVLYNLGRFVIESIREDSSFTGGGFRIAQLASIGLVVVGIVGLVLVQRTQKLRYQEPVEQGQ